MGTGGGPVEASTTGTKRCAPSPPHISFSSHNDITYASHTHCDLATINISTPLILDTYLPSLPTASTPPLYPRRPPLHTYLVSYPPYISPPFLPRSTYSIS